MTIDDVVAIDIHTHPQTEEFLAAMGARRRQMGEHFKQERRPISFAEQADMHRDHKMMAVLCNSDDETVSGVPGAPNDLIGKAVEDHPDVFIPFAGIDPHKGEVAIEEIRRCHDLFGIKGIGELNPARQKFFPNDETFYPIWEVCQELGIVVMFHMGFAGAGAGIFRQSFPVLHVGCSDVDRCDSAGNTGTTIGTVQDNVPQTHGHWKRLVRPSRPVSISEVAAGGDPVGFVQMCRSSAGSGAR